MNGWRAGDKCVCVDDSPPEIPPPGIVYANPPDSVYPKKDVIYLVTGCLPRSFDGRLLLTLAPNPPLRDYGWLAHRFRKVVPRSEREGREQTELRPMEGFWQGRGE